MMYSTVLLLTLGMGIVFKSLAIPTLPVNVVLEQLYVREGDQRLRRASNAGKDLRYILEATKPPASSSSLEENVAALTKIYNTSSEHMSAYDVALELVRRGLTSGSVSDILDAVAGLPSDENNDFNNNTREPNEEIYPLARYDDAPYDVPENQLRGAIYIPSTFQYGAAGAPQPVILVPGTSHTAYESYRGTWLPLLNNSDIGDPVWLNVPGNMLNDAQTNAEYVAYAINYIHGVSNQRPVAVVAHSQGNIGAQWAYKYWPSTRRRVTDHIGYSADYHGSALSNLLGLVPGQDTTAPSILQQKYDADFIAALRSRGGDSAYVPTTNLYSAYVDEVVEPQFGPFASGALSDARRVGVTNNEVQEICPGQPSLFVYSHEGVLYNPVAWALARDALSHDGPGQVSRLGDLGSLCASYLAQGLGNENILLTEDVVVFSVMNLLRYPNKVTKEPPIKSYALSPPSD